MASVLRCRALSSRFCTYFAARAALLPLIVCGLLTGNAGFCEVFSRTLAKDILLKDVGHINITNLRGSVSVQGWSQDLIRVVAKQSVTAISQEEADRIFAALDVRQVTVGKDVTVSAEYGKNLDVAARLKERRSAQTQMDLEVMAPTRYSLNVWTVTGAMTVKNWSSHLDLRTFSGAVLVSGSAAGTVKAVCPQCSIQIGGANGPVRCQSGSGDISLNNIKGGPIYAETGDGKQFHTGVVGDQTYVTSSGSLRGFQLSGKIEFRSKSGSVDLRESVGFVSGSTDSGSIFISMSKWNFLDKALIESYSGNVELILPVEFAGEVDLWSVQGALVTDLQISPGIARRSSDQEASRRKQGVVRAGREQLRVLSIKGDVKVSRRVD